MASVVNPASVDPFSVFTASVSTAGLDTLTLSDTAADYDWSGICWQSVVSSVVTVNCQSSGVLVTDRHALGVWHCGPLVGDTCRWRAPDGSVKEGEVEASTRVGSSDLRLVRFVDAPHESLKRYEVVTNVPDYDDNRYWAPQHSGTVALRYVTSVALSRQSYSHTDGGWGIAESSSGKPGLIPYSDGSLKLLGLASTTGTQSCPEGYIDAINTMLSSYSETLTEYEYGAAAPHLIQQQLITSKLTISRLIS